jgi:Holliday junction DNA helicase RuvB
MRRTIKTETSEKKEINNGSNNLFRPSSMEGYIGQGKAKKQIEIAIRSAKIRKAPLGHILLYGPPGLGKTTMAYLCASEMDAPILCTVGSNLEKPGDVAKLLSSVNENSILFIDEIHRINPLAEECLYSAMEDGFITITFGQNEQLKTVKMTLPPFTLVGATTRAGMISSPLRDRFLLQCKMEYYTISELIQIAKTNSINLGMDLSDASLTKIAESSRGTPRIVNKYLTAVRDYAYSENKGMVTDSVVSAALILAGVREQGLTDIDLRMLTVLSDADCPLGLSTISHILGEDPQTVEDVYEPYLIMRQFIIKTPRGRVITEDGKELLAKTVQLQLIGG